RVLDRAASDGPPVALQELELLEVDVDRVLPAAGAVLEDPVLGGVAAHAVADAVAAHELAVDLPLAVPALEAEVAREARFLGLVGELVEGRLARGIDAVVPDTIADAELEQEVARAGTEDVVRRSAAVLLLEAVLEVEHRGVIRERVEVDDDVHALGHAQAE